VVAAVACQKATNDSTGSGLGLCVRVASPFTLYASLTRDGEFASHVVSSVYCVLRAYQLYPVCNSSDWKCDATQCDPRFQHYISYVLRNATALATARSPAT
jgi:hypothetical protein